MLNNKTGLYEKRKYIEKLGIEVVGTGRTQALANRDFKESLSRVQYVSVGSFNSPGNLLVKEKGGFKIEFVPDRKGQIKRAKL